MATQDINAILRVPSKMCINPTSIAFGTTFPFGGTSLGLVKDIAVMPNQSWEYLHDESWGVETIDALYLGEKWAITAALRSFDTDAINTVFPGTSAGSKSSKRGVDYPSGNSVVPGQLLSSSALKVLIAPDDTDHYPMVYFPNALPTVDPDARLEFKLNEENLVAVHFYATRDSSARVCLIKRKEDLTL